MATSDLSMKVTLDTRALDELLTKLDTIDARLQQTESLLATTIAALAAATAANAPVSRRSLLGFGWLRKADG